MLRIEKNRFVIYQPHLICIICLLLLHLFKLYGFQWKPSNMKYLNIDVIGYIQFGCPTSGHLKWK